MQPVSEDEDDEDEDEETLQLKIKAYEAKLKLKRLQRSKAKTSTPDPGAESGTSIPTTTTPAGSRPTSAAANLRDHILVPLSPTRKKIPSPQPASPARVLLGLENKAAEVSLKRARYKLSGADNSPKSSRSDSRTGNDRLRNSPALSNIKSFGERLAESRVGQREQVAKRERIEQSRSQGFGVQSKSQPKSDLSSLGISGSTLVGSSIKNSSTAAQFASGNQTIPPSSTRNTAESSSTPTILEPYSGFHLTSRQTEQNVLARALTDKQLYSIPQILKEVKAPDYDPPDCESDYVIFGIVAHKSAPYEQRMATQTAAGTSDPDAQKPVFMVLKLTDLEWELDLFLFKSSVEAFYRVPIGTVVAVLNPGIMKPKGNLHSGAFSLCLSSSDDVVLEIGQSRHLGFCKAKKANGLECLAWIDNRKTEVCEYHISLKVDKARKGRMEFSTMTNRPGSSGAKYSSHMLSKGRGKGKGKDGKDGKSGLKPEGRQYDSYLHEQYYIAPSGTNLTKFLDDNDADVAAWQKGTTKEALLKKREKDQSKERELAKKLASLGSGGRQGSEYLKASVAGLKTKSTAAQLSEERVFDADDPFAPRDAAALGLLSNTAASVSLASTSKRKFGAVSSSRSAEPMGWGGASKRGLLLPPSPKKQADGDAAPKEKKRARFLLESKGIREPGRESLGNVVQAAVPNSNDFDDDDDDDLEIV
jgi:minichromosome maintenance protein 10